MRAVTPIWEGQRSQRLRTDATQSGFAWPTETDPDFDAIAARGPGWTTAALFCWQAERLSDRDLPELPARAAEHWALAPLRTALTTLADGAGAAFAALDPIIARLPTALGLQSFPALALTLVEQIDDPDQRLRVGELASWLIAASWAGACAADGRNYIAAFTDLGPHWRAASCTDLEFDRLLLRSYLNDTPTLQISPTIAELAPQHPDDWMLADRRSLGRLERELARLPLEAAPSLPQLPDYDAGAHLVVPSGGLRFLLAEPITAPSGRRILPVLFCGPDGCTLLEASLLGDRVTSLERPPVGYIGLDLEERIELLNESLGRALAIGLSQGRELISRRRSPSLLKLESLH